MDRASLPKSEWTLREEGLAGFLNRLDPDYDTPEVLRTYADGLGAPPEWLFATGPREALIELSRKGFLLGAESPGGGGTIVHSERFILVDRGGRVRGTYDSTDAAARVRLMADARALLSEAAP